MVTYDYKKLVIDDSLVELDAMQILTFLIRLYYNNTNGYSFFTTRIISWNNMFYSQ